MDEHRGSRQAVRISHVSRRFRSIALGDRNLWTSLRSEASEIELDTFLSRSGGDVDFHGFIHIVPYGRRSDAFMKEIQLKVTSCRWRTLSLRESEHLDHRDPDNEGLNVDGFLKALVGFGAQLDHLQELRISGNRESFRESYPSVLKPWAASVLQSLRCLTYIPAPSPAFSSVMAFAYSVRMSEMLYDSHVPKLLSFISSLPSLTEVQLELDGAELLYFSGYFPSGFPDSPLPHRYLARPQVYWHPLQQSVTRR